MKFQLVSFKKGSAWKRRLEQMIKIINDTDADLIMFNGRTLNDITYIDQLESGVNNKRVFVLFEVEHSTKERHPYYLYKIQKGKISSLNTKQLFAESSEIEGNEFLCERYLDELETKRCFTVKDKKCLVIQCGENNIVKNSQSNNNRPGFRFEERKDLKERFLKLLEDTDIVLNPGHTPMGYQGKIRQRRILLSSNKRYYFYVCNAEGKIGFDSKRIQYGYYNGKELYKSLSDTNELYSLSTYIVQ